MTTTNGKRLAIVPVYVLGPHCHRIKRRFVTQKRPIRYRITYTVRG